MEANASRAVETRDGTWLFDDNTLVDREAPTVIRLLSVES